MKIDFLKQKAKAFLDAAKYDISKKKWFLAAFHLEQACQLYLKYYLFLKLKDFPKVHELDTLLKEIGKVYKKEKECEKFSKKNASVISDLNQAYITSRYLPVEFSKESIGKMLQFTKDLINFLNSLWKKK